MQPTTFRASVILTGQIETSTDGSAVSAFGSSRSLAAAFGSTGRHHSMQGRLFKTFYPAYVGALFFEPPAGM